MEDGRPLFVVKIKYGEDSRQLPLIGIGFRKQYHDYFEYEYGEQVIVVYDYQVGERPLWMGDAVWEAPYKEQIASSRTPARPE